MMKRLNVHLNGWSFERVGNEQTCVGDLGYYSSDTYRG